MQEMLEKLYNYEYFGIYLMVSIAVLILIFIIILFYGKKDKKVREIEATKKLQLEQANVDALKVEDNKQSVEVPNTIESNEPILEETAQVNSEPVSPNVENDTLVFPTISTEEEVKENFETDANENKNEPSINEMVAPLAELSASEDLNVIPEEPVELNTLNDTPILDKVQEKPFVFENIAEDVEEQNSDVFSNVEVPEFNFDNLNEAEPVKEEAERVKNIDVFSSVFAPHKEEDIPNIDLPEVSKEVKPEEREEVSVPTADEMEIELPSLKKEVLEEKQTEEINKPMLNDYNLDDLTGETYDINK